MLKRSLKLFSAKACWKPLTAHWDNDGQPFVMIPKTVGNWKTKLSSTWQLSLKPLSRRCERHILKAQNLQWSWSANLANQHFQKDETVASSLMGTMEFFKPDDPTLEEYKKHDRPEDRNDDFATLVSNAYCFMVGTTIEDMNTWFWFFSQAIVLTSESFNFIEDYTHLIEYVLNLSFATAEEPSHNMSVTHVTCPVDEEPSGYMIQYDYHALECGWFARLMTITTPQCVLKDVWVPFGTKTEFKIQQEIFQSIKENSPDINVKYHKHFVMISQCEVVQTSQARIDDMPVQEAHSIAFADIGTTLSEVWNYATLFTALVLGTCLLNIAFTGTFPLATFFCMLKWQICLEYTKNFLFGGPKNDLKMLFKHIFPYCLDGGPACHDILVTGNFLEAAVDLPSDYQRALEQFVFLQLVLVFRSQQTYDGLNFPQYKNFDSFYSMKDPDVNMFSGFETVAEAAYSSDTQLLPDKDNKFHLFEPNPNNAHRPPVATLGVQIPPKQELYMVLDLVY
ncbi:hypothetical protein ARMGADRAFT_1036669 [Armillaria gallica]|uniref:Fungal-type protein kinase domain-containing protein n=1 Tax=Armillaria gallica TaxID=47427 RepID=A0A2H3D7A6_ARMGA|nr:hypothetical protein ARMGADRAFT_1036669 [Armillaria gallica]